ncbi:MAG: metal ABC transporter substrate-binding protein [Gemmatimonadota bacterium]|nr:MAG: metal ABC transporter substrate-binding protein [Gemmatimonadota bacterium]
MRNVSPFSGELTIGLLLLAALGCDGSQSPDATKSRPRVVASIFPIADLASALGGDDIQVDVLLAPGASPATFELTPGQLRSLRAADVYLSIGAGLDSWVSASIHEDARVVVLTEDLELIAAGDDEHDGNPHVWLDPVLVRDRLLPLIALALQAAAPEASERIGRRWASLTDSLSDLEAEISRALDPIESRAFLASHPAWTYYANRFDLEELGTVHESPGIEPSPRALASLIDKAHAAGVTVVFSEPQLGEAAAYALADELGGSVFLLDPLGGRNIPGRDSYFALMRYNTAQLVAGLGNPN